MKKHFSLLLLVLGYAFGYGQSTNWKQIKTPNKTSVDLLYQSKDGILFGRITISDKLVISTDNGQTWSTLSLIHKQIQNNYRNIPFKESEQGVLYYFNENKVFIFDKNFLIFNEFISLSQSNSILDLDILYNGDLIVGISARIILFSNLGLLKNSYELPTFSMKFLAAPDSSGINYLSINIGNSNELLEFSTDLNFVGNKKDIGSSFIMRYKNRLVTLSKYSDNGGTSWVKIPYLDKKSVYYCNYGADNRLYFIGNNSVFITSDGGDSFVTKEFKIENVDFISSTKDSLMVIGTIPHCDPQIYINVNGDQEWQKTNSSIGFYYTNNVYPGIDENLFVSNCQMFRNISSINLWKEITFKNSLGGDNSPNRLVHLSNNEIIAELDFTKFYKSVDNGENWISIEIQNADSDYNLSIIEKVGILYYMSYDTVHYSKDFGKSWQTKFSNPSILYSQEKFEFSNNFDIYYHDKINHHTIVWYNLVNQQKSPLNFLKQNEIIQDFATSFQGKQLYILTKDWTTSKLQILTTINNGQTLFRSEIGIGEINENYKLQIDHLNNLYAYTKKTILFSSDQGATWLNITPVFSESITINELKVSYDNYIYVATSGLGILKYIPQLKQPKLLKVSLFEDINKNCQKNPLEPNIKIGNIVVNDNYVQSIDSTGEVTFFLHENNNTITVQVNESIFVKCKDFYNVTLNSNSLNIAIPLKTIKYCTDLVTSISTPFLRRCFDNVYYGQVCNEGNIDAEDTKVKIILDNYFDLIQSSLPQLSHVGNELILDAGTIKSGACKNINLTINLSCGATLGQEHCVTINSKSRSQDCNTLETRNPYIECQENIGAVDPNDKAIFVNGVRNQTYLEPGDKLEYMIRFQNTGTDTAFTVKIADPISTKFDVATIRPVAASHDYVWSVDNGTLNVVFNQIMLVDSFKNEPASHGFIKFEITLDNETMINQQVSNIAGIYFDFNEAVITNEVITPVGKPVSTHDWAISPFYIYPNPTFDAIFIKSNENIVKNGIINIFDEKGQKLLTKDFNGGSNNKIHVNHLPAGFYIVQIINNKMEYKTKFIKM